MIKEIATHILSRTSVSYWARDINFFVGHLPIININDDKVDTIKRVAVVLENVPADEIGDLPDRADKPIQIWNRAASFFQARDDAYELYEILHGSSQWVLPELSSGREYCAMIIDAQASPAPIENPNEEGLFVFSGNYIFRIAE